MFDKEPKWAYGRTIALRVQIVAGRTTIYHQHTDHLGSTRLMSDSSGDDVSGSTTRYYPFGDWRTEPTAGLTDRGYTGHQSNNLGTGPTDLGLIYMNARYYLPTVGKFASPDTIVPDPAGPQSFNRYSYTQNNPVNRIDPSGHLDNCATLGDLNDIQGCGNSPPSVTPSTPPPNIPTGEMITFDVADGCTSELVGACVWSEAEMATIRESATLTGTKLAETLNAAHPGWNLSADQAFLLVYGGSVSFKKTGGANRNYWGETFLDGSSHVIEIYGLPNVVGDEQWAVHELGHAFVNEILGGTTAIERPITWLQIYQKMFPSFPNRPDGSAKADTWGFASGRWEWQRSDQGTASEEFADMYLGWVYNQWEASPVGGWTMTGQARASFMNSYMPMWVDMAINH